MARFDALELPVFMPLFSFDAKFFPFDYEERKRDWFWLLRMD